MSLSVAPQPEAKVILSVAYKCYSSAGNRVITFDGHADVNQHDVFRISKSRNMFTVLRWNAAGAYNDMMSSDSNSTMPVWLDWAIRDNGALSCATAKNSTRYACVSPNSDCVDSVNGPGYYCTDASKASRATPTKIKPDAPLFLLLAGSILRRNISKVLRILLWLAYVGADAVAVFGLGLISHYGEKKCQLRGPSFGDAQPFLWIPFLLVHLGGQDSITAYSIEDNNLWLRHLLTLGIQGSVALYISWKSIDILDNSHVLIPAALTFISGIIKYGERIWALRSGSRGGLAKSSMNTKSEPFGKSNKEYMYAHEVVLHAQGLLIGRTVLQLGGLASVNLFVHLFSDFQGDAKHRIVVMELAMMFDLLYTKARVLHKRVGRILRFSAQICMVFAFVIFLVMSDKHVQNHDRLNVGITYTLFVGAIIMELCSVAMAIASPWTKARLGEDSFLHWLFISNACSIFMAIQWNKMMRWLSSDTIGQCNYLDCIMNAPKSRVLCAVISELGLGGQWKNLWHVNRIKSNGVVEDVERWFDRIQDDFQWQRVNQTRLSYTLSLPFENALYRLHIFTDYHICWHFDNNPECTINYSNDTVKQDLLRLKEDCEKLSNYMFYLKQVRPSMLPVSVAPYDDGRLVPRPREPGTKLQQAKDHANMDDVGITAEFAACPFDHVQTEEDLRASLEDIKEIWIRLLVYAAGKCGGELHARQLGEGGELLSFVWLLMVHHDLGDAARREYKLLISDHRNIPEPGFLVPSEGNRWTQSGGPRYAFDFRPPNMRGQERRQIPRLEPHIKKFIIDVHQTGCFFVAQSLAVLLSQLQDGDEGGTSSREAEGDEAGTSRQAEGDDGAGTSRQAEGDEGEAPQEIH
ncbi:hypothetical protein HU200_040770 [Digitaria exilis]|uniref:DUF4220 domain-containing protein n=1 Tax=Digitaria exilis TaxID=1010633 RepID=A0A835B7D6_9POAL|nr:hypothetical protein HU200_040770 [Digitaria exilis]